MAIHTQESLSGFIAFVKIGQEHYRRESDRSFTQTETIFHNLVAFRKTAERAHQRFAKGDKFIAEGYVRQYDRIDDDRQTVRAEEFVAKKIGHDLARTRYTVDRRHRTPAADSLDAGLEDAAFSPDTERRASVSTAAIGR